MKTLTLTELRKLESETVRFRTGHRAVAPRLVALTAMINEFFPDLTAKLEDWSWQSYRKHRRIITHKGPVRKGKRLTVCIKATCEEIYVHNGADPARSNWDVVIWIIEHANKVGSK